MLGGKDQWLFGANLHANSLPISYVSAEPPWTVAIYTETSHDLHHGIGDGLLHYSLLYSILDSLFHGSDNSERDSTDIHRCNVNGSL